MPARSQSQRSYLNMKFGHAWVKKHHFDNKGKLPKHVGKKDGDAHKSHHDNNAKHGTGYA